MSCGRRSERIFVYRWERFTQRSGFIKWFRCRYIGIEDTPEFFSPLAGYAYEKAGTEHIHYIAADLSIRELAYISGSWVGNNLSVRTNAPPVRTVDGHAVSPLVAYASEFENTQHVIYIGINNGDLQELYHPSGGRWSNTNLQSVGTPHMNGTPLAGYSFESERTHHVIYIDFNSNVHELYRSGDTWGSGVVSGSIPISQ